MPLSRSIKVVAALVVLASLVFAGRQGQRYYKKNLAAPRAGEVVYRQDCMSCHGPVGEGVADTYYESGTNLWDVAAGLAIIKASGGYFRLVPTGKRPLNFDLWASAREEWTR